MIVTVFLPGSTGKQENESVTVVMLLLSGDVPDGVNEQEEMSSL